MARLNTGVAGATLMIETIGGRLTPRIRVESAEFAPGKLIPDAHSDYADGMSPTLRWSDTPEGTRSVTIIAEDPDAPRQTFTHWLLYNLPPTINEVPAAIPPDEHLPQLNGAAQGRTTNGVIGYFGPHPLKDDAPHHYHFEVFCLDTPLNLAPGATRDEIMTAMAGHVLAKGEVVGIYEAPTVSDR